VHVRAALVEQVAALADVQRRIRGIGRRWRACPVPGREIVRICQRLPGVLPVRDGRGCGRGVRRCERKARRAPRLAPARGWLGCMACRHRATGAVGRDERAALGAQRRRNHPEQTRELLEQLAAPERLVLAAGVGRECCPLWRGEGVSRARSSCRRTPAITVLKRTCSAMRSISASPKPVPGLGNRGRIPTAGASTQTTRASLVMP
jgi:hypothetical protein